MSFKFIKNSKYSRLDVWNKVTGNEDDRPSYNIDRSGYGRINDGNDLFIVLSTVGDQCLCSTSTPSESSTDCIDADDCIWLESHCISLNFSK